MTFFQRFIRLFFSTLSPVFPRIAGKLALELFQHPHAKKTRQRELELYDKFNCRRIPHPDEDIFIYEKGPENGYPVILVHGWESNAGSMYAIAKKLFESGMRVIVLGLPAHGRSRLKKTNMVHASKCIAHLLKHEGITRQFSMVTHSFGSGASALALMNTKIEVDKLIFLTTPDRINHIFENFADMISLGKKAYMHLIKLTEAFSPVKMGDFNISDFVQKVSYKELLILHDKNDKILPWKNAEAMKRKNPDIDLIPLNDKGHYRLLWDDEVIEMICSKFSC